MHSIEQIIQRRHLVTAIPDEPVLAVARRMSAAGVGAVAVLDGEKLVGVFSERDLMNRVVVAGRDSATTPVASVMTRDVVTASLRERRSRCIQKMQRAGCRHLPVLLDGHVLCMLSMRDLLQDEIEEQGSEIQQLRAYVHQAPVCPV